MLNRSAQPDIVDATDFNLHLKPYKYFTLDNGVPVYAIDAPEQEVALLEWVFSKAGYKTKSKQRGL